jgi:hypothetical protein
MTTTSTAIAGAVARYAERFHGLAGSGHHIASPLGAWLLLALCAPAATGETRAELGEILGADPDAAAAVAADLLDHPHALVASAAALWRRPEVAAALAGFAAALPAAVSVGDLPSQAELDAWARQHTLGLIERFPLELAPDTLLILATALATKVSWEVPFEPAPAAELGPDSPWASRVTTVLRAPERHEQYIATTSRAGDVAVHTATAQDGLAVTSVLADRGVAPVDVLAAAYECAAGPVNRRSLFDLPLGDSPMWTLREERVQTTAPDGREERYTTVLPAWSATSDHNLTDAALGMPAAARALAAVLGRPDYRYEAKQSAVARYSRFGFEAAAVTAMMMVDSVPVTRAGLRRVADRRFGHPYAVVATATQWAGAGATGPWHGLPVFSAWITDIVDEPATT